MNIDFNLVIQRKLAQMEADGVIQKKIEDTLEKSIMEAIHSELNSFQFRNSLSKQLESGVSKVAADCGLSAYNTFITERARIIVEQLASEDLAKKIQAAVEEVLVQKHESVKLSDIFCRYREYVMSHVEDDEKYDRQYFTSELDVRESGVFKHYRCRFGEYPEWEPGDDGNVEVRFCQYRDEEVNIGSLEIDGHDMKTTLKLGYLSEFERFVTNLYFNGTKVVMDVDVVDDINDNSYIDY